MMRNAVVAASVVSAIFLLACAKTVIDAVPTETDKNATVPTPAKDAGPKDSGTTKKTPPKEDPPADDPPATGGECSSETTFDTCLNCCGTAHQDGYNTFYGSYIECLCTSACATECSLSLCDQTNPTQPDAECDACIQANGNSCQADVSAACSADPDCIAFDKCIGDSQCQTKP